MPIKTPARFPSRGGFFCLLFCSLGAQGQPAEPFATRDQNPLVAVYGLPLPVNARLLPAGDSQWLTAFNITNTLNVDSADTSDLVVDTETTRLDLVYDYGLPDGWMLRLQFGVLHHGAGYFDSWIYDYHDFLGLKQGDRANVPDDQFQIHVSDNSSTLLNLQTATSGLTDTQIQLGKQLSRDTSHATSLWASLKLPTGDQDKLSGSGHGDFALWLATQQQNGDAIWIYSQLGGLYIPDTGVLTPLHRHNAWFGNLGISYTHNEWLQLKTQLDAHSPMYDSQLDFLDSAIQLTFGGTISLDKKNMIDIAMSEDIKTSTSPDVTLNITWAIQF
jgi:hypothetical protein